jgi:hypothetical protein
MAANLQPWHPSALATPYMGGARMGGTRRRRVEPTDEWEQLKQITSSLISTGLLVQDPDTEEVGLFRFTPKGLAAARRQAGS